MRLPVSVLRILQTVLLWAVILLVPRPSRLLFASIPTPQALVLNQDTAKIFRSRRVKKSRRFIFSAKLKQPVLMSMERKATALETLSSNALVTPATVPGASPRFPVAIRTRCAVFSEDNVAQTAGASHLQGANR